MANDSLRRLRWGDVAPRVETDTTVSVQTTVTSLLLPNPNRVQAVVVNDTANTVRLRWDSDPTTTLGIPVPPSGGFTRFTYEEDGERVFGNLRAIASAVSTCYVTSDQMPAARKVA